MDKVNFWSIVHMTLILIVGFIQVQKPNNYSRFMQLKGNAY